MKQQTVEDAKQQYRTARDPKNVTLGRRALVHFAVDPDRVAMTTRLAGAETQVLPFNGGHGLGRVTRRCRAGTRRRTCGSGCGSAMRGWICCSGSSTSTSR